MTVAPGPTRLLLVDDTADLRLLLRVAFESTGRYQVVAEAGDGLEAIELATTLGDGLDLVVLDLAMPRMDGLEVLPHLRARLPKVPVVVLSGFAATSTEQAALDAGASLYLEKGLRPAELLAQIESAALGATGATAPVARASAPRDPPPAACADPSPAPPAGPTGATEPPPTRPATPPPPLRGAPSTHEVVAELAHDVRSPLFVAREVVRVLRGSIDDEQLLHLADRAMAAVDRVDATLESAIEHARLGQAPLTLRRHELRGLLIELTASLDERAARRVKVRGPAVHARVDRGAFTRIAANLVDNALRYSDGRVEVSTCVRPDGSTCVCVRDHGPGLGPSPEGLFAPFTRGSAGRERAGTGLGLATALRLTARMDGTLHGEDVADGGARFRVELPPD